MGEAGSWPAFGGQIRHTHFDESMSSPRDDISDVGE